MSQLSEGSIKTELDKVKEQVEVLTGQKEMKYLRPPRGIFNEQVLAASKQFGYINVFWSVAYKDWDVMRSGALNTRIAKLSSSCIPEPLFCCTRCPRTTRRHLAGLLTRHAAKAMSLRAWISLAQAWNEEWYKKL